MWAGICLAQEGLFALIALGVTDREQSKIGLLDTISGALPRILPVGEGLNPHLVGGMLAILLPGAIAMARLGKLRGTHPLMGHWQLWTWAGVVVALLMSVVLVLTQSRTAMLVALLVVGLRLSVRRRIAAVLLVALAITIGVLLLIGLVSGRLGPWMTVFDSLGRSAESAPTSWPSRVEAWQNAVLAIRDYSTTGVGLNAFGPVAWLNYAFDKSAAVVSLTDARNVWLQAGVDLGLVGLVAFLWFSIVILLFGWVVQRRRGMDERLVMGGMWLSVLAWFLYGTLNVVGLGTAPTTFIWMLLGVLIGTWGSEGGTIVQGTRRSMWWAWLLGALVLVVAGLGLRQSPAWALNRGANILDRALLNGTERPLPEALDWLRSAGRLSGVVRRQAMANYALGNREQAVILLGMDSDPAGYLYSRVRLSIEDGNLEQAEDLALVGLEVAPESGRLTCLLADAYRLDRNPIEALRYYKMTPELASSFGDNPTELAACYRELGTLEGALGWWQDAADHLGAAANLVAEEPGYALEQAWALFQATGELSEAVSIVEGVAAAEPESLDPLLLLADMYLAAGRGQKALEWGQAALTVAPASADAWVRLAQAYWLLNRQGEAQQALAEALQYQPDHVLGQALRVEWGVPEQQ